MAYRPRTLPPAPPPSSAIGRDSNHQNGSTFRMIQQYQKEPSSGTAGFGTDNSRCRSISSISHRTSASNHSVVTESSSCSSADADSITPHSLSPTSRLLDDHETSKIEMFYRSHRTFVYVGQCLVTLYFTETELVDGGRQSRPKSQDWKMACQPGVPVLLFNRGDTRSRDKRQIRICIAEHGTGFQLWSDIIDNLSNYQAMKPTFHTMYLSTNHRKMAGFNFDNQFAALEFYRQIEIIVANPLNISLTGPKKSSDKSTEKFKLFRRNRSKSCGRSSDISREIPPLYQEESVPIETKSRNHRNRKAGKTQISQPCLFQHITSINLDNFHQFDTTAPPPSVPVSSVPQQKPPPPPPPPPPTSGDQRRRQSSTKLADYSTPFPFAENRRQKSYTDLSSSRNGTGGYRSTMSTSSSA